jgi:hypothetical protein
MRTSVSDGGQGETLVPNYTPKRVYVAVCLSFSINVLTDNLSNIFRALTGGWTR